MKNYLYLIMMFISQWAFTQDYKVDTLVWSGPSENRINLVILGDGYQIDELPKFVSDANNLSNSLFRESPYREYKNYFNVYAIEVPSYESGASHPGDATDVDEPAHPISFIDNFYGSSFDNFDIHRLLIAKNSSAIFTVLANNFPAYDLVLMLVNSPYYGGSGGQIALTSLEDSANEIAIHEIGHTFSFLADEYYAGDFFSNESFNMTKQIDPELVKWKNWLGADEVGIYQHCCGGNSSEWYRPHQDCKMRRLGSPFCPVCKESTVARIDWLIRIIDSYEPELSSPIDLDTTVNFEVELVEPFPNTIKVEWILNGELINGKDDSVSISPDDLLVGQNQLQFTAVDTTALMRIDNQHIINLESVLWDINSSTVSIDDVQVYNLKIEVFPNPTQEVIYFIIANEISEDYKVTITDISGATISTKNFDYLEEQSQIKVESLPSGVYFINFSFENGLSVSRKMIKE